VTLAMLTPIPPGSHLQPSIFILPGASRFVNAWRARLRERSPVQKYGNALAIG
jgi:hypothetical protein